MEWKFSNSLVDYEDALRFMDERVELIAQGGEECLWFLEHPPLYTQGTSAKDSDLLEARFPVYKAGRGGEFTYHGPGQRVVYVMLDLNRRKRDIRGFVSALERWIIAALADFQLKGQVHSDRVGVWIERPEKPRLLDGRMAEDKIAAIGIRLRKWVSFHGISINIDPDLSHFGGIVPCGITEYGVTSLVDLGLPVMMSDVDNALKAHFEASFADFSE